MSLYLAKYTLIKQSYPDGEDRYPGQLRIVEADREHEARRKLRAALEREDKFGNARSIDIEEISEVIS